MRKKFTMLLASLLAFVGVVKAGPTDLPQITTDPENPIYYTIYSTRSGSGFDRTFNNGGLLYYVEGAGIKDGRAAQSATLEDVYKFYFTGTHDALYIHNAAAPNLKLASKDSWTEDGSAWQIAQNTVKGKTGLVIGESGKQLNQQNFLHDINHTNQGDGVFMIYHANDVGSFFAVELASDYVYPVTDGFYIIECPLFENVQNEKKGLYVDANGNLGWNTVDNANRNFYWIATTNADGTVQLKNLGKEKYLGEGVLSDTPVKATLKPSGANQFSIKVGNYILHANGHGEGVNESGGLANWAQIVNTASGWRFVSVDNPDGKELVTLVYEFFSGETKLGSQEVECFVGDEYPAFHTLPFGVTATRPSGNVSKEQLTVRVEVTITLPFKYADSYDAVSKGGLWYYLKFDANSYAKYYLYHTAGANHISLNKQSLDAENLDLYTWGFVGNPFDGFKVVNKAAGADMILSSSTTMEGETGSETWPIMTSTSALDGKNEYWILSNSTNAEGGFYMEQKGHSNNKLNNRNDKLAYWTGGSGPGSTMVVEAQATANLVDLANGYLNMEGVGYPADNSSARTALSNAVAVKHEANINAAIVSFKTSEDITLPEDGKAYTIANFSHFNGGTTRHLNYTEGEALSVKVLEEGEEPSVFVCKKLSNGAYTFVTVDGKVLTWMNSGEGYKENDAFRGYSSNYAAEYSNYSDWNRITVKKNGTTENDFGHLRLVARRYARDNEPNSSFIIQGNNGAWDKAGDSYFLQTPDVKKECYSSAWILTEVEHANTDAENLAIAKIGALDVRYELLAEGIGGYHYVINDAVCYSEVDVKSAVHGMNSVDEVNNLAATCAINQPAAGFYRIKSMNGNVADKKGRFLEAYATGMKLAKDGSDPDNKYTSVFYVKDNTILSYSCGQYLNSYGAFDAVGAVPTSWVIEENAAIVGTYALKYEENANNNGYLSDWLNIPAATEDNPQPVFAPTNGLNDANAAWTLEEVEWLPVAMNTTVGWATLYSPVELNLYNGRVNAYTGELKGDYLALTPQKCIPANEGVILEYITGDIEDGCVFLPIQETSVKVETNDLKGTFAAKAAPTDEGTIYTLQKNKNGEGVVFGIYAISEEDSTVPNLNGFRAYLPITTSTSTESIGIRFEGTTDIEHSTLNPQPSTQIYDLLGRRVEAITKGGIYIVNGKKVVIK